MLDSIPVSLVIGTLLGFLSGLGIGGGSLLILWLTIVLGYPQAAARTINLLFFLPAALISSWFRLRKRQLNWHYAIPAMLAGSVCAAIASHFSHGMNLTILRKLFGFLLIVTGIREILYRGRK